MCGLPVKPLGEAPYQPVVFDAMCVAASDVKLAVAEEVPVYLPPNVAGYIGGDHVAAQVSVQLRSSDQAVMLCDIGTNTEIGVKYRGQVWSCSCASGPAFEGAHISQGMKAQRGAISHVNIHDGIVFASTVDGAPSRGICGSGMLDAVAELLKVGALTAGGQLNREHALVSEHDGMCVVVLDERVAITQEDISVIQLAKGAIRVGIDVLLERAQIDVAQLDAFYLAGAFGTYLDLESACVTGLIPSLDDSQTHQVGNAAGLGAVMLLLSESLRETWGRCADSIQHVALTEVPGFSQRLARSMMFPARA